MTNNGVWEDLSEKISRSKVVIPLYVAISITLVITHLTVGITIGFYEYLFGILAFIGLFIMISYLLTLDQSIKISIFAFALVAVIASFTFVFMDASGEYARFGVTKNTSYWFFSSMLQGFAALLGIIGGFLAIQSPIFQRNKPLLTDTKPQNREGFSLKEFYPAIHFIAFVLILSLICLPLSPVLEIYPAILITAILVISLAAILSVSFLIAFIIKIFKPVPRG